METFILVVGAIVCISMVVGALIACFVTYRYCLFRVTEIENDDDAAADRFLDVLDHAHHELLIHDDGDRFEGSVYENDEAIQAVRDHLEAKPDLRIRCLLNFNEGVKMANLSTEYADRFQVRYLHRRPVDDFHFKIADGGKMSYLSTHRKGSSHRKGEIYDGTEASKRTRKLRIGGLVEDFYNGFDKAWAE